jgi:hypothetical protein
MKRVRHALHAAICIAAVVPWLFGVLAFGAALMLTLLADKTMPDAVWGNCWTFVGPRWFKRGGYFMVCMAPSPRLFGRRIIPHAIWVRASHAELDVEQTAPVHRVKRFKDAWRTLYFKFVVKRREPYPRDNESPL